MDDLSWQFGKTSKVGKEMQIRVYGSFLVVIMVVVCGFALGLAFWQGLGLVYCSIMKMNASAFSVTNL